MDDGEFKDSLRNTVRPCIKKGTYSLKSVICYKNHVNKDISIMLVQRHKICCAMEALYT
jgi:hypothetical protein